MIIDTHTHIFPDAIAQRAITTLSEHSGAYKPNTEGRLSSILESMDEAGVSCSWIANIATKPTQASSILKWSKEIQSERIFPLASVHPLSETWEADLEAILQAGMRRIKLHPMYQNFFVDDISLSPFFSYLEKHKILVLFHSGYDIGFADADNASPRRMRTLLERHPDLTFIAAHVGGWNVWQEVLDVLVGAPCYFDTSFAHEVPQHILEGILEKHGAGKLLFGTDSPWLNQRQQVRFISDLLLSDADKEKIFYKNALELQARFDNNI